MFIGREKELSEMNQKYGEKNFQLFILYGRRRVGKTTFLKEFCKEKNQKNCGKNQRCLADSRKNPILCCSPREDLQSGFWKRQGKRMRFCW